MEENGFECFNLREQLLRNIHNKNFVKPSPVQKKVIPLALSGKNIFVRSTNGTGKTASFLIPIAQRVDTELDAIQAIIMVPTRELALQTYYESYTTMEGMGISTIVTTGGTKLVDDVLRLKEAVHVVVSTPGRIRDLVEKGIADVSRCSVIVLDEADELLSDMFLESVCRVIEECALERRIWVFSATYPVVNEEFMEKHVSDAVRIELTGSMCVPQYFVNVSHAKKLICLHTLIREFYNSKIVVFCENCNTVEKMSALLSQSGFMCFYLHSRMQQEQRNKIFHNYRTSGKGILFSTDLLTRGIDANDVRIVVNYDFPSSMETFLHRVGRTGRFGAVGVGISLVSKDTAQMRLLEEELKVAFKPLNLGAIEEIKKLVND